MNNYIATDLTNDSMNLAFNKKLADMRKQWLYNYNENIILDHNENNISGKANYQTHGNAVAFKAWLEKGLNAFGSSEGGKIIMPEFEIAK